MQKMEEDQFHKEGCQHIHLLGYEHGSPQERISEGISWPCEVDSVGLQWSKKISTFLWRRLGEN